ncbi:hypothetical protein D3C76_801520 [compost metagenome]
MLNPQLGQTHHVATAVNFLRRTQGAGTRIANAVVGDVVTVTVGQLDLRLSVIPAPQLLQIECHAQTELISVTRSLVVVVATVQVATDFPNVVSLDIDTLLDQLGTLATPVAGHPFRIGTEGIRRHGVTGQHQGRRSRHLADQPGIDVFLFHPYILVFIVINCFYLTRFT